MKTTQRLYEAAHPIWEQCHAHPFVRGIGDGSLDLEKFQWFLLQDYLYLFDYARVFAYGVVKARDPELMRTFSANVDAILGGEMKVHRAYMARLGITEEQVFAVQPALSNLSYTHYMLSCAAAGGPAEIIAAILSCSWSYAEIGQRLAAIPGAADHPFYGEWIRSYAGEDYQKTNDALVELMDRLAEGCTEAEYREYGTPYDLRVLEAAGKGWMNTIHCHGNNIMFQILKDYPVQVFNWHAWETLPALDEAYALTGKCLMGGLSRTDITQGNRGAIQNQIYECFKLLGGRHQILTPGCVIRYPLDDEMLSFIGKTRNEIESVFDRL